MCTTISGLTGSFIEGFLKFDHSRTWTFSCSFFFLFFGAGDQTQGLALARQVLYRWAKSPTPILLLLILSYWLFKLSSLENTQKGMAAEPKVISFLHSRPHLFGRGQICSLGELFCIKTQRKLPPAHTDLSIQKYPFYLWTQDNIELA